LPKNREFRRKNREFTERPVRASWIGGKYLARPRRRIWPRKLSFQRSARRDEFTDAARIAAVFRACFRGRTSLFALARVCDHENCENTHQSIWSQICRIPKSGAAPISSWTARRDWITPERRFETFYELSLQCDAGDSHKTGATGDTRRRVTSAIRFGHRCAECRKAAPTPISS